MKKRFLIIPLIIVFLALFLSNSVCFLNATFGLVPFDEILFQLTVPVAGAEKSVMSSFINISVIPTLITFGLLIFFLNVLYYVLKDKHVEFEFKFFKHNIKFNISSRALQILFNIVIVIFSCNSIYGDLNTVGFVAYVKSAKTDSKYIENNYVDPETVKYEFPSKKKNLIYIYVESLESSYASTSEGGAESVNLIPRLTKLANKNINFSNTDSLGGAVPLYGASWTAGGLVAQTSGLPLKLNNNLDSNYYEYSGYSSILKGATTLGMILEKNGYQNEIMFGSDKKFGSRNLYFSKHGDYKIFDYNTAIEKGLIPADYFVWWGFEDSKLFAYAQDEILELASHEQPFNFSLLTANTHPFGGYLDEGCSEKFGDNLSNVIYCTDKQLDIFVRWIQKQKFAKDTTIVISGDHLNMDNGYFDNIDSNYQRTVYNVIINSSVTTDNNKNRQFATIDMFPTTLASLGVKMSSDRLGLGTNLFSDTRTLVERDGFDNVNTEFGYKSTFFDNKIIYGK
jgi:phosphoglycerol transferase